MDHSSTSRQRLYTWDTHGRPALVWLACGALVVALLPSQLKFGLPLWKAQLSRAVVASLVAETLVAALLADWQHRGSGTARWMPTLAITVAAYVPTLLYLLLLEPQFPKTILLVTMLTGAVVVLVPLLVGPRNITRAMHAVAVLAAVLLGVGIGVRSTADWSIESMIRHLQSGETSERAVASVLYPLRVTSFHHFLDAEVAGGGIAAVGRGYLAASGDGSLFYIERDIAAGTVAARRLLVTIPINSDQFLSESPQPGAAPTWFRVTDLLVEQRGEAMTLFAVHNYWMSDQRCSVMRVSMLSAPVRDVLGDGSGIRWQTIYDSKPCQKFTNEGQGGRIVRLPGGELLLSVGVHDAMNNGDAQDPASSYGKTVLIDTVTQRSRIFTSGHRNPQGLAVTSTGDIWLTEHGPRGGDELDRLVQGANFGWPVVSYGLPYSPGEPPLRGASGSHEGFEPPVFAWIPSIGISNLVEVEGALFPNWRHDLIIASLVRTTLWRARVVDHRVAYVEEIKLDERIRDLIEDPVGRIVLWTDNHSLVFVEPLNSTGETGQENEELLASAAFSRCLACHVTTQGAPGGIGPNLWGIVGRPVAGAADYAYSDALRSAGGVWSEERLNGFLENPQAFAPGMRPEMQPVPDAVERRHIVAYLKGLR